MAVTETRPLITWIDAPPAHIQEINEAPPLHSDLAITSPTRSTFDEIWDLDQTNHPFAAFSPPPNYHSQNRTDILRTLPLEPLYEVTRRPLAKFCATFDSLLRILEDILARTAIQKP